jgi:hypothetical protein
MKSISPHVPPESQQEWRSWLQWNSGCRAILEWWGLSLPVDRNLPTPRGCLQSEPISSAGHVALGDEHRCRRHAHLSGALSPPHALDSGVFGKVAGIMTAKRRDRLIGVGDLDSLFDGRNRGLCFPVSRESKYPAYQPLQRSASLLVNRLSRQTLSPFACLLLRTT